MSTAIAHIEHGAVASREDVSILSVIARAASDPSVDVAKMEALLGMQERIMAKQAEIEFNRDFAAASKELPRVAKNGVIDMGAKGKMPFAKYEDVDRAIKPIESKYGFTRSYSTAPSATPGIEMTVKLTHRAGHSEKSTRHMPPDPGPGRNAMQAIGSAGSYAKRYLTLDIWNIVTEGEDDDAQATGYIDERQIGTIIDMFNACNIPAAGYSKLLDVVQAKAVSEIHVRDYPAVIALLRAKLRKQDGR